MFPYLVRIGGLSIPAYPLLYGTGIAVAGAVAMRLGRKDGLDVRRMAHLVLIIAILILVGGRLFHVLIYAARFRGRWGEGFDLSQSGQVHYGGLTLAVIGGVFAARALALPLGRVADTLAVGIPLGLVFGRLGCLCYGCCFGRLTSVPWAVTFPPHVDVAGNLVGSPAFLHQVDSGELTATAARSLPVHPSQLYEAAVALLLFGIMLWLKRYQRFRGRLLLVYCGTYCIVRFFLEFTRVNPTAFWGLTVFQVVGVVILVVTMLVGYRWMR